MRIQSRGHDRSASVVPTIDLDAAEQRIAELEDQLEDAGLALFLQERLGEGEGGSRVSASTFLAEIGMDEYIEKLPRR